MQNLISRFRRWFGRAEPKRSRTTTPLQCETLESRVVPAAIVNIWKTLSLDEGQSSSIAITRSGTAAELNQTLKVRVKFTDGTAKYGEDFTRSLGPSTIVTLGPGTKIFRLNAVAAVADHTDEWNQTFTVNLSLVTGYTATFANNKLTATIVDKDREPIAYFDVEDNRVVQESAGVISVPVKLTVPKTEKVVTVDYRLHINATRQVTYGKDLFFTRSPSNPTGRVTFQPGETQKLISVIIVDDKIFEGDQPFQVRMTAASNAAIGNTDVARVLIEDNDSAVVTINDAPAVKEGHENTTAEARFKISISPTPEADVTFRAATVHGSAHEKWDYVFRGKAITIPRGTSSVTFTVPIVGDRKTESGTETFYVKLAKYSPFPGVIPDPIRVVRQGIGTILDDDQIRVGIPQPISATHTPESGFGTVLYRWAAAQGASIYQIHIRKENSGFSEHLDAGAGTSYHPHLVMWLDPGTYYWKIRAINTKTNDFIYGEWSAEKKFEVDY